MTKMDIEQMLAKCGDFGRYQFMLLALFSIINILAALNYYSQTIISFVPDHWCYSDLLANLTYAEIEEIYSTHSNPSCSVLNGTDEVAQLTSLQSHIMNGKFVEKLLENFNENHQDDLNSQSNECNRWIYNLDFGYESMTSDLNWVCGSAWKSALGQSMFFVGSVVGSLLFGIWADRIGRLHILVISNLMALLGNGSTMFATNVIGFSFCRFVAGLATDSNFVMMYILVMEYIRPSMRTFGLNLCIGVFYCIGSVITPWLAVAVGSWKTFLLITALPVIIVPVFYFFVQESALWLISKNDVEAAITCFERVAKINGKILDPDDVAEFRKHCAEENNGKKKNKSNLLDLFKTPRLRKNTLILFFKSMVITLCYDATSRNVEGLGLSPFVMFSLSAMAILPACVVLLLIQDMIGRKAMASSSLLVSGVFTAATGIIIAYNSEAHQDPALLAALSIIGRFGVTVAYNSGAQYATELIPTCVRGQGVAAVHVAGYALTFFSSYILLLSNYFAPLPALILGSLSLAGSILVLFLPETLNRVIPSTLEDGERFGMGEKILYFSCFDRSERNKSESTTELGRD